MDLVQEVLDPVRVDALKVGSREGFPVEFAFGAQPDSSHLKPDLLSFNSVFWELAALDEGDYWIHPAWAEVGSQNLSRWGEIYAWTL